MIIQHDKRGDRNIPPAMTLKRLLVLIWAPAIGNPTKSKQLV